MNKVQKAVQIMLGMTENSLANSTLEHIDLNYTSANVVRLTILEMYSLSILSDVSDREYTRLKSELAESRKLISNIKQILKDNK